MFGIINRLGMVLFFGLGGLIVLGLGVGSALAVEQIAYVSGTETQSDIYLMDVRSNILHKLTHTQSWYSNLAWSPDGEFLAFVSILSPREKPQIYRVDFDGRNLQRLTDSGWYYLPTWSPDGKQIAFLSHGTPTNMRLFRGTLQLYVMDADGENLRLLAEDVGENPPRWSPDSGELLFTSYNNNPEGGIYMVSLSDGQIREVINGGGFPDWSADGRQIVFIASDKGDSQIYVVDAAGGERRAIANAAWISSPRWSPDNQRILFENEGLFVASNDGEIKLAFNYNKRTLYPKEYYPAWSPDGNKIAFSSWEGNQREIYVMDADGSDLRRLTWNDVDDLYFAWRP